MCLRGYIMKLGLLGVYRFCSFILPSCLFSEKYLLVLSCFMMVYFLRASTELDGKRWLAFLSLSHITVVALRLFSRGFITRNVGFIYSVGHGLSAGLLFILLWWGYEVVGSRK